MTQALVTTNGTRPPSQASGRLRRAAEHYVRSGCKAIGPSLRYAGFAETTAKDPTKNGYTHDKLVAVASYWSRGSVETARSHLATAVATLATLMQSPDQPGSVRGAAAKTILDVGKKEEETQADKETSEEEQARWMALIRHWKRTFLRRGILLGMVLGAADEKGYCCDGASDGHMNHPTCRACRVQRLLDSLNYSLGKGPRPEWMIVEENTDEENKVSVLRGREQGHKELPVPLSSMQAGEVGGSTRILGSEGDPRPGDCIEAEIVEAKPERKRKDSAPRPRKQAKPRAGATDPQ